MREGIVYYERREYQMLKKLYSCNSRKKILFFYLFIFSTVFANEKEILKNEIGNEKTLQNKQDFLEREEILEYPSAEKQIKIRKQNLFEESEMKEGRFQEIVILGEHPLKSELEKKAKSFLGKAMTKEEIYFLISSLTEELLQKGYLTSFVTLREGNINEGNLVLKIHSGKINQIYFEKGIKKESFDDLKLKMAFPNSQGKILNIQDLDQTIENLNAVGFEHKMEIQKTGENEYSDVVISRVKTNGIFNVAYDNSPYEKDRKKLNFSYDRGNILSVNDSLFLAYSTKIGKNYSKNKDENYDLTYSIPYGYYNFTYQFHINKTHHVTRGLYNDIVRDREIRKNKFKISKNLSRGATHKTTANISLNLRDQETYINKQKIEVSSKKYTTLGLGINHTDRFLDGNLYLGLSMEKGLPWFQAEGDHELGKKDPKKEFEKYTLNLDWRRYFFLASEDILEYRLGVAGTYSKDVLLDVNKTSIGDEYTVRGFKETSISGERGVYINNTLSYRFSSKKYPKLSKFIPFIGLDAGLMRDYHLRESEKIVGMAYGIKFQGNDVAASLTVGKAIKRSKFQKKEGSIVSFNIGYSF